MTTDFLPDQIAELPGLIPVPTLPDLSGDLSDAVRVGRRRLARIVPGMSTGPSTRTRVIVGAAAALGAAAAVVWWTRRRETGTVTTPASDVAQHSVRAA